jgi:thioredoxin-related protein
VAALAGIFFSRESVPAPEPIVSSNFSENVGATAGLPAFAARQVQPQPAWALPQSGRLILAVAALFGLYSLYLHGGDWLGALITPGAAKDAWPSDFKAALAQAHAEHKPVLLHFTGSDWCPACQELDRAVISTTAFRDYAAKNLVFVEVDMPHEKFQPAAVVKQNNDLCQEFEIQGFPTVILLNSTGKNLGELVGYSGESPKAYIAELEKFMKADGPH